MASARAKSLFVTNIHQNVFLVLDCCDKISTWPLPNMQFLYTHQLILMSPPYLRSLSQCMSTLSSKSIYSISTLYRMYAFSQKSIFTVHYSGVFLPYLRSLSLDSLHYSTCLPYLQCCGSGSAQIRNFCLGPDPDLLFRIRIQLNMKEHISKHVISLRVLDFVYGRTVV